MVARGKAVPALAAGLLACTIACAPKTLQLPTGAPTPLDDPSPMVSEAMGHCESLTSVTAELGLSGRVGSARLRGRIQAGFAKPGKVRLEAVAPFGAPIFIVAGQNDLATMWLPRDARVLRDEKPSAILEALAGLAITPDQLGMWLAGCAAPDFHAQSARTYGPDWVAVDGGRRTAWLRRIGTWRLVRSDGDGLRVEFAEHRGTAPGQIRIQRQDATATPSLDVRLAISQLETNVSLTDKAFTVDVPADAAPMTLEELRASGPLRDTSKAGTR